MLTSTKSTSMCSSSICAHLARESGYPPQTCTHAHIRREAGPSAYPSSCSLDIYVEYDNNDRMRMNRIVLSMRKEPRVKSHEAGKRLGVQCLTGTPKTYRDDVCAWQSCRVQHEKSPKKPTGQSVQQGHCLGCLLVTLLKLLKPVRQSMNSSKQRAPMVHAILLLSSTRTCIPARAGCTSGMPAGASTAK